MRAGRRSIALAALIGSLAVVSAAHGAVELDPTFGGDGKVVTDFGSLEAAFAIAVQSDGKVVAAGRSTDDFALARYNPDGRLDPSFDGDGRVVTDLGALDTGFDVAIQQDGRIVVVGDTESGDRPRNFALVRYNPDGKLDQTFGGDGRVVTDFGHDEIGRGVAVQADGKIVAAGLGLGGDFDFTLARYNPDGSLDQTFDADGRVVTSFGSAEGAYDVAIQPDGRIVAAGYGGRNFDFALARYRADGSLDATFDGDGRVLTNFGPADEVQGIAIQADGRIVAAGLTSTLPNPWNFALARYNGDGSLDPEFGGDGKVQTDFGALDLLQGVAIHADGKIVAVGESTAGANPPDFALARYKADGSLDSAFDGDGRLLTDIGERDGALDVAIQADGRIVAAGATGGPVADDFALARYVEDQNRPPNCSTVSASPSRLRPPNHRFRLVSLTGSTDPDNDVVRLTVTNVSQDEPLNGLGDGDRSPDARLGTQSNEVFLRAERSGTGDGRVYRVSFTGADGRGGSCSGVVRVAVPRGVGSTTDSAPPSYDSLSP